MTRHISRFVLFCSAVAAFAAVPCAFGRGGAGGGEHADANRGYNNSRAEDRRPMEEERRAENNRPEENRADTNADHPADENHTVNNPFVHGAEAAAGARAVEDRTGYDGAYGYRNPYYWGPWGPIGDWNTSSPPPVTPVP